MRHDAVVWCSACPSAIYCENFSFAKENGFRHNPSLHEGHEVPAGGGSISGDDVERFYRLIISHKEGD